MCFWQKLIFFVVLQQTEGNTEMKFFLSLILSRAPFPHSLSISSHFLIFSPFSLNFLILFPFSHSLSIFSFSVHFLILSPSPLNFLILSPFSRSLAARLQQLLHPKGQAWTQRRWRNRWLLKATWNCWGAWAWDTKLVYFLCFFDFDFQTQPNHMVVLHLLHIHFLTDLTWQWFQFNGCICFAKTHLHTFWLNSLLFYGSITNKKTIIAAIIQQHD